MISAGMQFSSILLIALMTVGCVKTTSSKPVIPEPTAAEKALEIAQERNQKNTEINDLVTVSMDVGMPLNDLVDFLISEKKLRIVMSPEFKGATHIKGVHQIRYTGRASGLLTHIGKLYDVTWKVENGTIFMEPYEERFYPIDVEPHQMYSFMGTDNLLKAHVMPYLTHGAYFNYLPSTRIAVIKDKPSVISRVTPIIHEWVAEKQSGEYSFYHN